MKRAAFLEQRGIATRPRATHRAVNVVISIAIATLLLRIVFGPLTWSHVGGVAIGVLLVAGVLLLLDLRRDKRKLSKMKWEAWLTAVDDRDIGGDLDFRDPAESLFLREKFEAGCSPYQAIAEWRRRKSAGKNRIEPPWPRTNKPTV
jgi:hypothetical protein